MLDELQQDEGPWVLLSSFFDHDDTSRERDLWFRVRTTLINEKDVKDIIEKSGKIKNRVHGINATPSRHYTFAGEVPWAGTFPENREMEVGEVHGRRSYFIEREEAVSSITFQIPESISKDKENRDGDSENVEESDEQADLTELELEMHTRSEWEIECKTYHHVLVPVL